MKIKKTALTAFSSALVIIALLTSCRKEDSWYFSGNYSFKTSGMIQVRGKDIPQTLPQDFTVDLITESGQMDITTVNSGNGEMVITMNVTGGDLLVYYATVKGDDIVLTPEKRKMSFTIPWLDSEGKITERKIDTDVTVSGEGKRYDNIILLSFRYDGTFTVDGKTVYEIYDSDINCRAKRN